MPRVEKDTVLKDSWLNFREKSGSLAFVKRVLHKTDTTGSADRKPAVVDVALRALTRTLIASKIF